MIGERILAAGTSLESGQILKILLELLELKFQPKPQVSKNNLRSNSFYQPTKNEKSTQCNYQKKEKKNQTQRVELNQVRQIGESRMHAFNNQYTLA